MNDRDHSRDSPFRKYLLGEEPNLDGIEEPDEPPTADEGAILRLMIEEADLIEDFLDDELSPSEIRSFLFDFLVTYRRRQDLLLIRNLRILARAHHSSPKSKP